MSGNQPLALANEAFAEQKGWRRDQELIDALPYVDGLQPAEKDAVNALIEEEMRRSEKMPSDYLDELPPMPPSQLHDSELVRLELERVARGEALAAMDLERYNLNPPGSSQSSDPAAWQAALDNAHAQLEHQLNRLLNLELLVKYGPVTWRAHNEAVASYVSRLEGEVAAARGAIDELNRERKLQQTAAGRELATLQEEYLTLVAKNAELEAVCCRIEAQADELQAKVPEGAAIADGPQNDAMR